jgi:hypothetical protein
MLWHRPAELLVAGWCSAKESFGGRKAQARRTQQQSLLQVGVPILRIPYWDLTCWMLYALHGSSSTSPSSPGTCAITMACRTSCLLLPIAVQPPRTHPEHILPLSLRIPRQRRESQSKSGRSPAWWTYSSRKRNMGTFFCADH